jgi:hypothetical protein
VAQPHRLVDPRVLLDGEGRRRRRVQDEQPVGEDLDLSRRHRRVDGLLGAPVHPTFGQQDILRAQLARARVCVGGGVGLEDDLDDPAAVAQVDEHDPAVVAPMLDPARHDHPLPDQAGKHVRAGMGPASLAQLVEAHSLARHRSLQGMEKREENRRLL